MFKVTLFLKPSLETAQTPFHRGVNCNVLSGMLSSSGNGRNHGSCRSVGENSKKTFKKYFLQSCQFSSHLLNGHWWGHLTRPSYQQREKGANMCSGPVKVTTWSTLVITSPRWGWCLQRPRGVRGVSRERSVEARLWWTRIPGSWSLHDFSVLTDQYALHTHHHHAGPGSCRLACF